MAKIASPAVYKITAWQLLVLLVITLALLVFDRELAIAAAVGGAIQIIPQAWFNRQAWRYGGASQTREIVRSMYKGLSGKLILTAALFAIAFTRLPWLNPGAVFAVFGAMILVQWLVAPRVLKH